LWRALARKWRARHGLDSVPDSAAGQPIEASQPWHLDHRDDRRGYLGTSHATCNLRSAAQRTNGQRKDHPLIWSRVWFEPVPPNVILSGNAEAD
jgi:hypothetical protein